MGSINILNYLCIDLNSAVYISGEGRETFPGPLVENRKPFLCHPRQCLVRDDLQHLQIRHLRTKASSLNRSQRHQHLPKVPEFLAEKLERCQAVKAV